ncbi:MAG: hypothetical protein KJZ84_24100 [Bryobacteraceae bacterium]|nr:hypothetical protein [Bryobacteraceae bacterium]
MRDLKTVLYLTVHGSEKTVEQLADSMGISASYLYRACLEGESGCRFPLDLLLPLIQATGDHRILDHLNARCGRVTTSLPRVGRLKKKDPQVVNEIQKNFNAVMAKVLEFFSDPDRAKIPEIERDLHRHLCEVASLRRTVKDFHQSDLF